jgi:hypothetical protein
VKAFLPALVVGKKAFMLFREGLGVASAIFRGGCPQTAGDVDNSCGQLAWGPGLSLGADRLGMGTAPRDGRGLWGLEALAVCRPEGAISRLGCRE